MGRDETTGKISCDVCFKKKSQVREIVRFTLPEIIHQDDGRRFINVCDECATKLMNDITRESDVCIFCGGAREGSEFVKLGNGIFLCDHCVNKLVEQVPDIARISVCEGTGDIKLFWGKLLKVFVRDSTSFHNIFEFVKMIENKSPLLPLLLERDELLETQAEMQRKVQELNEEISRLKDLERSSS